MPGNLKVVEETRRTWYGRKYTVYVLYDKEGHVVTYSNERHKVEMVKEIIEGCDD